MAEHNGDLFNALLRTSTPNGQEKTADAPVHTNDSDNLQDSTVDENNTVTYESSDATVDSKKEKPSSFGNSISAAVNEEKKSAESKASTAPTKKKNIKKYGVIASLSIFVLLICYFAFFIIFPAKTSATKISSELLSSEITSIYEEKIKGNSIKEKIFSSAMADYPNELVIAFSDDKISYDLVVTALTALKNIAVVDNNYFDEIRKEISSLDESKKVYQKAEELFSSGEFDEAINEYAKVKLDTPNFEAAQKRISECSEKYKSSIEESVESLMADNKYQDAIEVLEEANKIIPQDSDFIATLEVVKKEYSAFLKSKALSQGKAFLSDKKYEEAFNVINSARQYNEDDSELKALYELCVTEYESFVLISVEEDIQKYNFSEALNVIGGALEVLPDDENFKEKKTEIENKKPVSLFTMTMLNSSDFNWNQGKPEDPFGNDYSNSSNYVINSGWLGGGAYGEFRLYKKYKKLCGSIAPYTDIGEEDESYIQIFADDELVYTSPGITRKTDAFDFNINISDAEYIKIEFHGKNNYCFAILSNLMLFTY